MLPHFTITRGMDAHVHFRQGEVTDLVVPATARHFGYATVMPNTDPPITTIAQAKEYERRIYGAARDFPQFRPLCTAYVCEELNPDELRRGYDTDKKAWFAAKLYPKGGTTNSEHAAESVRAIYPQLEVMEEIGMPLLIHGEVVGPEGREHSRWQREGIFVDRVLPDLVRDFPRLKKVCEHVSTAALVRRVLEDESGFLAATITPHHALLTDADVSRKGLWTDANCLPIIKSPEDRDALQEAMISGDARFFAGTDSAPHDTTKKYGRCCSFGAYVAPGAMEAYATVFDQRGVFEEEDGVARFERFMSLNGPAFYGIPPSRGRISMIRNTHQQTVRERFTIPGKKILEPATEIVALFHEDLGLAPPFPWVVGTISSRD